MVDTMKIKKLYAIRRKSDGKYLEKSSYSAHWGDSPRLFTRLSFVKSSIRERYYYKIDDENFEIVEFSLQPTGVVISKEDLLS